MGRMFFFLTFSFNLFVVFICSVWGNGCSLCRASQQVGNALFVSMYFCCYLMCGCHKKGYIFFVFFFFNVIKMFDGYR